VKDSVDSTETIAPVSGNSASSGAAAPPGRINRSLARHLVGRAVADWSSQILTWGTFLIVARLLSPSDFGIVAMAMVLFSYLRIVGEFGIPVTVVTVRTLSEDQVAQLNTVAVALGIGCFGLACLLAHPIAVFFKSPQVGPVVIVACSTALSLGLRAVPEGMLEKDLRIGFLSLCNAGRDILAAAATLLMALLGWGYWSLVLGNAIAFTARSLVVLGVRPHRFALPRLGSIRQPLRFGWHVMVSGMAWSAYSSLDNVTAGRMLGRAALGFYGIAWNLANVPLEKITSLVTTVVPSYLAAAQNDLSSMRRYVRTLTEATALATFPATIGFGLVAREAVPVLLGQKWRPAIPAVEILCAYAAVRSVVALLDRVLTALGQTRFVMWDQVWALVVLPCAFYAGSHWGISGIAWGWVVAYPLVALPLYWEMLRKTGMGNREYFGALRPAVHGTGVMVISVLSLRWLLPASLPVLLRLILEIAAGALAYALAMILLHRARVMSFWTLAKASAPRRG